MADNEVSIVLTAIDNASSKIKGIGSTFKELTGINLGAAASLAGVGVALRAAGDFARDSINFFIDYSMEVKDMARVTGESTEEMSKLIQVADDVRLSTGTLTAAFRQMSMKGIDPTIDSIMKLADRYNSLSDPLERNKLLLDSFGRAGLEMGKMLEIGSEGIKAAGDEAEKLGLVLDATQIRKAEEARVSMDNLDDAVNGLRIALAEVLVPALTTVVKWLSKQVEGISKSIDSGNKMQQEARQWTATHYKYGDSVVAVAEAMRKLATDTGRTDHEIQQLTSNVIQWAYYMDSLANERLPEMENIMRSSTEDMSEYGSQMERAAEITDKLTQAQKDFGDTSQFVAESALAGDFGKIWEDYKTGMEDVSEEFPGWRINLQDAKDAQLALRDSMKEATAEMLFQKVAANMDATAAFELAKQWGLISQLDYDLARGIEDVTNQFDLNGIEGIQAEEATTRYYAAMNNLKAAADAYLALPDEYTKTYTFETYYKTYGQATITAGGPGYGYGQTVKNWDQFGGQWTVPSKYGYEGYNLPGNHSASPGETITVTPGGRETPRSELSDKSITALSQAIKLAILGY